MAAGLPGRGVGAFSAGGAGVDGHVPCRPGGMTPRAGHKRVDYIQGVRLMLLLPSAESVEVTHGPVEGATRVGASGGRMVVTSGGRTAAPVVGS